MTSFYVDDSVANNGNGSSWTSAWQNFSDINWAEVKPGDTIFVSGGTSSQTYHESLDVGASGTANAPITITAGIDPGHNGTVIIDGTGTSNATGVEVDQNYVIVQHLTSENWGGSAFRANGGTGSAFEYDTGNAGTAPGTESSSYGFEVRNTTNFTVAHDVGLTPSNMNIDSDTLFTYNNTNLLIENNHFTISNLSTGTNNHTDGWQSYEDISATFRQNFIDGTSGGINNHGVIISDVAAGGTLDVYNNILDMGSGTPGNPGGTPDIAYLREYLTAGYTGDVQFDNNTIYGGYSGYDTYETAGPMPAGDEFKNNIIYATSGTVAPYILTNGNLATPSNIDNNLVYNANGTIAQVNGTNETWAGWQGLGYDAHGVNADPQFVNAATQNFELSPGSPAIDHGATLPMVTTDYLGTPRPQGAGYDIGAYEFVPSGSGSSTPTVSIGNASAPEGGIESFTVALSQVSTSTVDVQYATHDGTAVAGVDYTAATGTLTFAPGQTTETIAVQTLDHSTANAPTESFTVTLSNPTDATLGSAVGTGTIVEGQDAPPLTSPVPTPDEPRTSVYPDSSGVAHGTAANEIIHATGAGQTLIGGGGDDIFAIGSHADATITETKPGISEVLTTASHYTLPDGIDNLAATGHGSHILTGNAGDNVIYGSNGNDTLIGGGGNNELVVGTGENSLTGGAGDNSFVFSSPKDHGNVITDFNPNTDMLDLRTMMKAIGYHGSNPVADGYVSITSDGHGDTVVSVDPDGSSHGSAAHAVVTLQNVLPTALHDGANFVWH